MPRASWKREKPWSYFSFNILIVLVCILLGLWSVYVVFQAMELCHLSLNSLCWTIWKKRFVGWIVCFNLYQSRTFSCKRFDVVPSSREPICYLLVSLFLFPTLYYLFIYFMIDYLFDSNIWNIWIGFSTHLHWRLKLTFDMVGSALAIRFKLSWPNDMVILTIL